MHILSSLYCLNKIYFFKASELMWNMDKIRKHSHIETSKKIKMSTFEKMQEKKKKDILWQVPDELEQNSD